MALDYSSHIILTGDINIDFTNLTNVQLRDCLALFNLTNVIDEPTRITDYSSSLIDPILVSDACSVLDSGVIPVENVISDHKATYVSIKAPVYIKTAYYREVWIYKNADYPTLNNLIRDFDWNSVINDTLSVDEACDSFTTIFLSFCKTCIPLKKVLIRPNDKPWFNSELRQNIRRRDRLRRKALKSNNPTDRERYKHQRNHVNNLKKYARENYMNTLDDLITNTNTGSKAFWQIMGRFMDKNTKSFTIPPLNISGDNFAYTDLEKANALNDYFCSISTIDDTNIRLPAFQKRTNSTLSHITILESEVVDILRTLKINKAVGPDCISHRMLKYTCETIAVPLCKLFNLSLQSHTYPKLWKLAHVMPIFKKGDKSLVSNYRPISLISCVGKSFERVIYKNVYNHLMTNSLIHKYQSGFLPGHSTVHHLIELIHHTCIALENHKINCQIFCDISKAFDRVWHRGLLLKLENYGITSDLLMWFQSYLCHRNQKVFVNEKFSLEKFISAGVPQGSVLGPLLFLIFINDISDDLHGMTRLFADDTSLSYSSLNIRDMQLLINTDLIRLSEWASRWLIRFNPQKTEVMLISNTHIEDIIELRMDNTVLDIVNTHKHLGVILSSNNKWSSHIDSIINSASKQISFLRKIKYKFSKKH